MSQTPSPASAAGMPGHPQFLQAGLVCLAVAVLAAVIVVGWVPNFLASFPNSPFTNEVLLYVAELVGFYALVFLVVGMLGPPGSPRDYFGGAALIAVAIFAYTAARDLPGMRGFAFGPGTAPRMFAGVLAALGLGVSLTGMFTKGAGIDRFYVRGPFFVTLSVVAFAWLVRPMGLVVASFLSICAAAGATPEARIGETILWGIVLTAFCSFLFPYALNLPMQMGPISCDPTVLLKGQPFVCDPAALLNGLKSIR